MAGATSSAPVGTVEVVDPHPLNWLFITWNTMVQPVRTDERGHIVGAAMEASSWVDGASQAHAYDYDYAIDDVFVSTTP